MFIETNKILVFNTEVSKQKRLWKNNLAYNNAFAFYSVICKIFFINNISIILILILKFKSSKNYSFHYLKIQVKTLFVKKFGKK